MSKSTKAKSATKATPPKNRELLTERAEEFFPPPPIGGPAPNTQRMSQLRRAMVDSRHGHKNVAQFERFLEQCVEQFDAADVLREELERVLETQSEGRDYVFGLGDEGLDALVREIQESADWGLVEAGAADLVPLDSRSAKKNRRRLRKWLLEQRPTQGLESFLGYVDKIRDEIGQIVRHVESGRKWVASVYDNPDVAKDQGDMFVMCGGFSGPLVLRQLTEGVKKKTAVWLSFVQDSTSKPEVENVLQVTLEELMHWREQRMLKREAVQARIAAGVSEKRVVMKLPEKVAQRVCKRLAWGINAEDGVSVVLEPMSMQEVRLEVEVEELKAQLETLLCGADRP